MRTSITLLLLASAAFAQQPPAGAPPAGGRGPQGPGLTLSSPDFKDGDIIPDKHSQKDPAPTSPKLEWTNVPAGVMSFALIVHDPDTAPMKKGEDILHWMVFNIPGTAKGLDAGQKADAMMADGTIQAKSFRGAVGYMGMGAGAAGPYHHYTFELYALDMKLDLKADAARADVLKALDGHVVAKAALVGRFHR